MQVLDNKQAKNENSSQYKPAPSDPRKKHSSTEGKDKKPCATARGILSGNAAKFSILSSYIMHRMGENDLIAISDAFLKYVNADSPIAFRDEMLNKQDATVDKIYLTALFLDFEFGDGAYGELSNEFLSLPPFLSNDIDDPYFDCVSNMSFDQFNQFCSDEKKNERTQFWRTQGAQLRREALKFIASFSNDRLQGEKTDEGWLASTRGVALNFDNQGVDEEEDLNEESEGGVYKKKKVAKNTRKDDVDNYIDGDEEMVDNDNQKCKADHNQASLPTANQQSSSKNDNNENEDEDKKDEKQTKRWTSIRYKLFDGLNKKIFYNYSRKFRAKFYNWDLRHWDWRHCQAHECNEFEKGMFKKIKNKKTNIPNLRCLKKKRFRSFEIDRNGGVVENAFGYVYGRSSLTYNQHDGRYSGKWGVQIGREKNEIDGNRTNTVLHNAVVYFNYGRQKNGRKFAKTLVDSVIGDGEQTFFDTHSTIGKSQGVCVIKKFGARLQFALHLSSDVADHADDDTTANITNRCQFCMLREGGKLSTNVEGILGLNENAKGGGDFPCVHHHNCGKIVNQAISVDANMADERIKWVVEWVPVGEEKSRFGVRFFAFANTSIIKQVAGGVGCESGFFFGLFFLPFPSLNTLLSDYLL